MNRVTDSKDARKDQFNWRSKELKMAQSELVVRLFELGPKN